MPESTGIFPVYEVIVHPSDYDGPEHDIQIAVCTNEVTARRLADEWILTRQAPHPGNSCGCTWEVRIIPVELNRLETWTPLAKPGAPSMNI